MTITRTWECTALNHVTLAVTGDVTYTYHGDMDDLTAPVTEDEKAAFVKSLIRCARSGKSCVTGSKAV
jgi:hypothetical protein